MSIKWRNKIFKASIVSLAFLLTINPLDLNSVIRANEQEKTVNSDQKYDFNNNQRNTDITGDGKIDMKQVFDFKGIARKNQNLKIIPDREISNTASFIPSNESIENTANTAKILTTRSIAGNNEHDKQTVFATSKFPVNLRRDFEIEASVSMKKVAHGFVFALHGNENYTPQGTDDSLGVYYNKKENFNIGGLENSFIMEIDTYDNNSEFGDNAVNGNSHIAYNETGAGGGLKYSGGKYLLGKSLKSQEIDSNSTNKLFKLNTSAGRNQHVRFTFSWDSSSRHANIIFNDTSLSKYNLQNVYIDSLDKLKNKTGKAYISIGGTTDWAGKDFMEIGVHRIKYKDLIPNLKTEVKTEENMKVNAVYPGQKIVIKHYLYNTLSTPEDITDDLKLHMLYLQFLNEREIGETILAGNNFEPEKVKMWVENDSGNISDVTEHNNFNPRNPVPIKFPSGGRYYVLEYAIKVPTNVDREENYFRDFYLFFQAKLGQNGIEGISIKEKHQVRLLPKITSDNRLGEPVSKEKHDVFKYYGALSDNQASRADILYELWDQLFVTSSVDKKFQLNQNTQRTPGNTKINKRYYVRNGNNLDIVHNNNDLPNKLPKSSSVTLVVEVIDGKIASLKSYYYRTIVIGDSFRLSDDGDYLIYGKHIGNVKDTDLNTKTKNEFIDYVKQQGSTKSIKRDSLNPAYELSTFSNQETSVNVDNSWVFNNKMDFNPNPDLSDRIQNISIFIQNMSNVSTNINFNIQSNHLQNDDEIGNIANGKTAYVIIPSKININVNPLNHDEIIGNGNIYLSGYNTRKNYHVWVDKSITLTGNGNKISLVTKKINGDNGGPSIGNDKEYLGIVNQSRNVTNPLKIELRGNRYKGNPTKFIGNINFYIKFK